MLHSHYLVTYKNTISGYMLQSGGKSSSQIMRQNQLVKVHMSNIKMNQRSCSSDYNIKKVYTSKVHLLTTCAQYSQTVFVCQILLSLISLNVALVSCIVFPHLRMLFFKTLFLALQSLRRNPRRITTSQLYGKIYLILQQQKYRSH